MNILLHIHGLFYGPYSGPDAWQTALAAISDNAWPTVDKWPIVRIMSTGCSGVYITVTPR